MPAEGMPEPVGMRYTGAEGGPEHGPSREARECTTLAGLFLLFMPLAGILAKIAIDSNRYAQEMVTPVFHGDRKRPALIPVQAPKRGTTSDAWEKRRPRFKPGGNEKWKPITKWSLLAFFGILIALAAMGTRTAEQAWTVEYGTDIPWIRNAMSRDAFMYHRRYCHFGDGSCNAPPAADHPKFDPLHKIRPFINHVGLMLKKHWNIGRKIVVDESMIKYMGRAISWVMYMPAKPIKHGMLVSPRDVP
jgi:hypothetical protein